MTRHNNDKEHRVLLDHTASGKPIYLGDPCPTLYDRLPDGRPVYSTGPENEDRH